MSDSGSSSGGSEASIKTPFDGFPGIIVAQCHIQNPDITEEVLENWHLEHFNDLLTCPGNGNLCLRYRNLDPSYSAYSDPKLQNRPGKSPDVTRQECRDFNWKYLTLVKVPDMAWINSPQFNDLPFNSKVLPPNPDGSWGSVWDAFYASVRIYQKMGKKVKEGGASRPKYVVSIQYDSYDEQSAKAIESMYANDKSWRSTGNFKLTTGVLMRQEVGNLPGGLTVFEFDEKPDSPTGDQHKGVDIVRHDAWEIFVEKGDSSLEL